MLDFYHRSKRVLPWRGLVDPYAILVSEFMLQQTRVETVIPYFHRWMRRFPTPEVLARADTQEVLRNWEGLGYYSRARNLQRAARQIVTRYGGRVPDDPESLRTLPGVGPYTAGAVASMAFGTPTAAVDGNARRVLARLADDPTPTAKAQWAWAARLVDPDRPGEFNQAIMELGAQVCTPRAPRCDACPVASFCAARKAGSQASRPLPTRRRAVPQLDEAVVALLREDAGTRWALLRRRPEEGLLAGMWEFPGAPVSASQDAAAAARHLCESILDQLPDGLESPSLQAAVRLSPVEHVFTHRRVRYIPFLFRVEGGGATSRDAEPLRWVKRGEEATLPIPPAQRTLWSRVDST